MYGCGVVVLGGDAVRVCVCACVRARVCVCMILALLRISGWFSVECSTIWIFFFLVVSSLLDSVKHIF